MFFSVKHTYSKIPLPSFWLYSDNHLQITWYLVSVMSDSNVNDLSPPFTNFFSQKWFLSFFGNSHLYVRDMSRIIWQFLKYDDVESEMVKKSEKQDFLSPGVFATKVGQNQKIQHFFSRKFLWSKLYFFFKILCFSLFLYYVNLQLHLNISHALAQHLIPFKLRSSISWAWEALILLKKKFFLSQRAFLKMIRI